MFNLRVMLGICEFKITYSSLTRYVMNERLNMGQLYKRIITYRIMVQMEYNINDQFNKSI